MTTSKLPSMATWAIAYDLDVKGMKNDGYTKSDVTTFYNQIRRCLADHNFEKLKQWSIYTSKGDNSIADAFQVCVALKAVEDAEHFIKRLHLFRIEDYNDLLPLVKTGSTSAEDDEVEEKIEEVFAGT